MRPEWRPAGNTVWRNPFFKWAEMRDFPAQLLAAFLLLCCHKAKQSRGFRSVASGAGADALTELALEIPEPHGKLEEIQREARYDAVRPIDRIDHSASIARPPIRSSHFKFVYPKELTSY